MKYYSFVLVLLVTGSLLWADTVNFRSGKVLSAELTSAKIKISGINQDAPPELPAKTVFAVVSVKLGELRSVSVFDYVLSCYGKNFACVAVNSGNGFVYADTPVSSRKVIQLLFATDGLLTGKLPQETLTLKSKFPPANLHDAKIVFTNLDSKAPTAIADIPENGTFKKAEQK